MRNAYCTIGFYTFMFIRILITLTFSFVLQYSYAQQKANVDTTAQALEQYGFQSLFVATSYNTALPYDGQIHPQAWGFIQDYLSGHGKSLEKMKSWGLPYFTLIDNVLTQYGLPRELKYLAVIESGLNSQAESWVGARGPWQFMPGTAKQYGLQVNGWIDERTDYFRSTHAAAKFLADLYKELNDWLLVIAAYNGGPGRVYDAIKKAGNRDFWKLQYYLPAESRTHVKKFIATHYVMEGKGSNTTAGKNGSNVQMPINQAGTTSEWIAGKYNSLIMAKFLGMDITYFNQLNPRFDAILAGNNTYELKLPPDKMNVFQAKRYPILQESVQQMMRFYGEGNLQEQYPSVSELPEFKKPAPKKKNLR